MLKEDQIRELELKVQVRFKKRNIDLCVSMNCRYPAQSSCSRVIVLKRLFVHVVTFHAYMPDNRVTAGLLIL